ncbi:MAG: TadE family protein [Thiohalocapsa sp.]
MTSVEFAIVLPTLLLIVLGLVEFSRAIWMQTALDYAVQAAARCAAVNPSLCPNVPVYAASQAFALWFDDPASVFNRTTGSCSVDADGNANGIQVNASLPFDWLVHDLLPYSTTLTASACFPR